MSVDKVVDKINAQGYAFLPRYRPTATSLEVAESIGTVFDLGECENFSTIGTEQVLKPTPRRDARDFTYSKEFGLSAFPLHSDLAHWPIPPRYILLRCLKGFQDVATLLLDSARIIGNLGIKHLDRAILVQRRRSDLIALCPLSVIFKINNEHGIRWDQLFLFSINQEAKKVANAIDDAQNRFKNTEQIFLSDVGDTLIIDNWRMLHGRERVPRESKSREISRIYLSELKNET